MLTVDLVRAYRRAGELRLSELRPADRQRAEQLADRYLAITKAHIGHPRGALAEAMAAVPFSARDKKLCGGLRKLIIDRCDFEARSEHDPVALRQAVFERASQARRAASVSEDFDRDAILRACAAALADADADTDADADALAQTIDRLLYADLKHEHKLLRFAALSPAQLVADYQEGQAQAVLLRARRVVVEVSSQPGDMRALFRKLKFLRLLYTIEPAAQREPTAADAPGPPSNRVTTYRITIDGPYSLFRSVTKYGLGLALMLPALRLCERWSLKAEVEWGKSREVLTFRLGSDDSDQHPPGEDPTALPDEVQSLLDKFNKRHADGKTPWAASISGDILSLPGVGLCVPDLLFVHTETGECIYLEVMGFWSRDAVWRRVELVESGLPQRILFAVSSRLRVSEAALGDDAPGALYVYKGAMSARTIEDRLERLRAR